MLPDDLLEVNIDDVSITNVGFALFFKPVGSDSPQVVPIFIGPLETYSISSALDGITPQRPNSHDLMISILKQLDAKVLHVVISGLSGNVFYATIVIQLSDHLVEVDARPSDSVALALRAGCPIFMHKQVYEDAAVVIGDADDMIEGEDQAGSDESSANPSVEQLLQMPPERRGSDQHLLSEDASEADRLQEQLKQALENENYEEAAKIRDRLRDLNTDN